MSRVAEWIRRRWWPWLPLVLAAVVAVVIVVSGGRTVAPAPGPAPIDSRTRAAVERFLDRYMDANGRVVRRGEEEGGSGSAGQAYAMLAAVAVGDRRRFDLAWTWARKNLRRPDGLLASRWAAGDVTDDEAASDADLDAARALVLAAERFEEPDYLTEVMRIAPNILIQETVKIGDERVLVAGPWARWGGAPYPVNPSYFSPRAFGTLAKATDNGRFSELNRTSVRLVDALTGDPLPLVPDWALVNAAGEPRAARRKGTTDPVRHGLDAARLPIRYGEACDEEKRALAARLLPFYQRRVDDGLARGYGLDGSVIDPVEHAMPLVAAAGAAHAAGDEQLRDAYLERAEKLERRSPTYYGSAWVALGRIMLTTELLGRCEP